MKMHLVAVIFLNFEFYLFLVPPLIIDSKTSPDLVVKEGGPVNLTCEARGSPRPKIMWRREDGEAINYKGGQGKGHLFVIRNIYTHFMSSKIIFRAVLKASGAIGQT